MVESSGEHTLKLTEPQTLFISSVCVCVNLKALNESLLHEHTHSLHSRFTNTTALLQIGRKELVLQKICII